MATAVTVDLNKATRNELIQIKAFSYNVCSVNGELSLDKVVAATT